MTTKWLLIQTKKRIMKKIIAIILLIFYSSYLKGQSVNSESTIKVSDGGTILSVQRTEIIMPTFSLRYDYKLNGDDMLGLIIPKLWSDSTANLSAMIVKIGDGKTDNLAFDLLLSKKFGKLTTRLNLSRLVSFSNPPSNNIGVRLSYKNFTVEAYSVNKRPHFWAAYHPKYAFISLGKQDKQYWGYLGTKNLSRFGVLTFANYQPETKNFWFKSQSGFGEINQKFFCQENYIVAANYLTIPLFYYLHLSPLVAKGTYTLKVEGRKIANIQNYELMFGKQLGGTSFGLAAGVNSEINNDLKIAPSFELYKVYKSTFGQCIAELRYDHLYKLFSAYLIVRY